MMGFASLRPSYALCNADAAAQRRKDSHSMESLDRRAQLRFCESLAWSETRPPLRAAAIAQRNPAFRLHKSKSL
jgi:hypothetical protein